MIMTKPKQMTARSVLLQEAAAAAVEAVEEAEAEAVEVVVEAEGELQVLYAAWTGNAANGLNAKTRFKKGNAIL